MSGLALDITITTLAITILVLLFYGEPDVFDLLHAFLIRILTSP